VINKYLILLFVAAFCWHGRPLLAAETNDTTIADLTNLVAKINAKIEAGKTQEADYADDLKAVDELVAKHQGAKPEDLVQILLIKVQLYSAIDLLDEPEKALEVLKQIKRNFPTVQVGGNTDQVIRDLEDQASKWKTWHALAVGTKFPDFATTNLSGHPLLLAKYKDQVVLVDFWATWCLPCQAQLPYQLKTYAKYHGKGFEIVGVSLDDDQKRLLAFINNVGLPWPQTCDGQRFDGKLATKYGIYLLPNTFLLNGQGIIIAKDLRGDALELAVSNALAGK
jgi:thiol-disulfide isomerase/thioredoxin